MQFLPLFKQFADQLIIIFNNLQSKHRLTSVGRCQSIHNGLTTMLIL